MLNINLKSRLENKTFWVSLISAIILLLQQLGLTTLANYIPSNYADIINTIFAIVTILGIAVDTSTPGISDQITSSSNLSTAKTNITNITTSNSDVSASIPSATIADSTNVPVSVQSDTSNTQTDSNSQPQVQDSTTATSDSTNSVTEDIKNAMVVNSTIKPKASTASTEDINA